MSTRKDRYFDLDEAIEAGTPLGISKSSDYSVVIPSNTSDVKKIRGDFDSVAKDMRGSCKTYVEHLRPQRVPPKGEWKPVRPGDGYEKSSHGDNRKTGVINERAQKQGRDAASAPHMSSALKVAARVAKAVTQTMNEKGSNNGQVRSREAAGDYAFNKYAELYTRTKR
ncbi:hypothetical protein KW823_21855 [Enterobacter quasiroggenkampii]|nr:hypothetical protein [Enterobacter quasiroggenkampii]